MIEGEFYGREKKVAWSHLDSIYLAILHLGFEGAEVNVDHIGLRCNEIVNDCDQDDRCG